MPTAGNQGSRSRPVHGAISETIDRKKRVTREARQSCAGECGGMRGSAVKCGGVWRSARGCGEVGRRAAR